MVGRRFFHVLHLLAALWNRVHERLHLAPPPEPQLHGLGEHDRRVPEHARDVHLHHGRLRVRVPLPAAAAPQEPRAALRRHLALHHPALGGAGALAVVHVAVARLQNPDEDPLVLALDLEPHAAGHPDGRRAHEGGFLRSLVHAISAEGEGYAAALAVAVADDAWVAVGAAQVQDGVRSERGVGERESAQHGLVDLAPAHPQVEDSKCEAGRRLRHGHGSFWLGNVTHVSEN